MKLAVFGATGPTGEELVAQALAADHELTLFARRPAAIAPRGRVRVVQGDTTRDAAAVADVVRGQDAVLSTLGVGGTLFPSDLMQRSVASIAGTM